MTMINASVVISTYNRAASLQHTLESARCMSVPEGLRWELLIIDNNSRDATPSVVETFRKAAPFPVRYFLEQKQGLSHARNRGVKEARGDIIAFTDDDIVIDQFWLSRIVDAFAFHNAACVGGRIIPLWSKPCPKWFRKEFSWYLGILDLGNEPLVLAESQLWGGNFAVTAPIFKRYGYFNTTLGRSGNKLYAGEETAFMQELIDKGEKVVYSPDIVVQHYIPEAHIRKAYFRKRTYDLGEQLAFRFGFYPYKSIKKSLVGETGQVGKKLWRYLQARIVRPRNAFSEELECIGNIGYLVGLIKYRHTLSAK